MINPTTQAQTNPNVKENPSNPEQGSKELAETINKAKAEADAQALKGQRIERATWFLLIMYAALTLAIGLLTIWSNRQSRVTDNAASKFNELQMAKIRTDAEYKIQVDTTRVREDAARDLKVTTEEVRGEAGKKVEEARAEANVKIESARGDAETRIAEAKAEAARQIAEVQKEVARQQERAAEAEKALAEVRVKIAPRRLTVGFPNTRGLDPANTWIAGIMYKRGDDEAYQFAVNVTNALRNAGWMIDEEPFPIDKDWTMDSIEATTAPKVRPGITILIGTGSPHLELRQKVLVEGFAASGFTPRVILTSSGRPVVIIGSKF